MTPASSHHARQALRRAASRARMAPSIHNTQPWHMHLDGDALVLALDPERTLPVIDPHLRQAWISSGCALFNARASLAGEDVGFRVSRFPEGADSPVFARLELTDEPSLDTADATAREALRELDPAISTRHTNRTRFAEDVVGDGFISRLAAAALVEDGILTAVRREEHREAVARLTQRADALLWADPHYRAELREWTTDNPYRRDGVQSSLVPHVDGTSTDEIPLRDFDTFGHGRLPSDVGSTRHQTMLVLGTEGDARLDWVRAGEALEHVFLEIARFGYATSPLMQALEIPATRAELRRSLGMTYYPQFLFRVGKAAPTPPSPRLQLEDVLTEDAVTGPARSAAGVSGDT
jgi:nitroreductase